MSIVRLHPDHDLRIDLAYATPHNFTQQPIYRHAHCYLHRNAFEALERARALLRPLGLHMLIFDALRPQEAQWKLWEVCPDPRFVADPRKGSPHGRGVAVDLTLTLPDGTQLDMGTPFDDFTPLSFHSCTEISAEAQRNRFLLLGIMTAAGWDFYENEWWHYQLHRAKDYPLISDHELPERMMDLPDAA